MVKFAIWRLFVILGRVVSSELVNAPQLPSDGLGGASHEVVLDPNCHAKKNALGDALGAAEVPLWLHRRA